MSLRGKMVYLPINPFVESETSQVSFILKLYFSYLLTLLLTRAKCTNIHELCEVERLDHASVIFCPTFIIIQLLLRSIFTSGQILLLLSAFTAPHNIILHSTYIHDFKRAKSDILMIHTKHLHLTKTKKHYLFALVLWAPTPTMCPPPPNIWCSECRK